MTEINVPVRARLDDLSARQIASLMGLLAFAIATIWNSMGVVGQESKRAGLGDFDILIRHGRIVDGTGAPWYRADVGIKEGRIVAIGELSGRTAAKVIDAEGKIVAPGFVDMMGQTATPMLRDSSTAINLLSQGITTINAGEGGSAAPLDPESSKREGWTTFAEYFALLEMKGLPVNVVQTVGHTQVRRMVLGDVNRRPSDEELEQMQALVREAMEDGAIGVSTALIYPPAVYADTREIAALVKVAGEYGGRYYTHMRNEGDQLLAAIEEALAIGEQGNAPVHIFHLKAAGEQNWDKMQQAIDAIKSARAAGQQVTADVYPYINNGLGIAALIHPRHFSEGYDVLRRRLDDPDLRSTIRTEMETTGGWENWFRHVGHDWNRIIIGSATDRQYAEYGGKSIQEIADLREEDPWDTFFQLVKTGAFALPQSMSRDNKVLAMQQPFVSFCTDVGPAGGSQSASHPRAFGAFPRLLAIYVRELNAITLERAISQASAVACNDVLAYDRGRIAEGQAADIVVFDFDEIQDLATFAEPHKVAKGMEHVIVNGVVAFEEGKLTGRLPGKVLRGPGFDRYKAASLVSHGERHRELAPIDQMAERFMQTHHPPGMSLAVAHQGNVVHARGYGYADLAMDEPVTPESRFRIASISKPITAVAILQWVEQGKFTLETPVVELLDLDEAIRAAGDAFDERIREITIRHLLQHRGGWDRDQSFDAMFRSVAFAKRLLEAPPAGAEAVIHVMMSQPLDFDPGERYAYSNFGYCLLGRVIEQVSGQTYEAYVQEHVLKPIGIESMEIGATRRSDAKPNEVRYYHPQVGTSVFAEDVGDPVPSPYGAWYLEAMDSHGGWLATATDLAKFAAAFDDPDACPLLSRESIDTMFARPDGLAGYQADGQPKDSYYSLGWMNKEVDGKLRQWHTGSLPGTAAILIRRSDGHHLVALLNTRVSPTSTHLGRDIDAMLNAAVARIAQWPEAVAGGSTRTNDESEKQE